MTTISEFYAGRSVLITGATGFMGKVLLEKLLRSCPSIKTIYLLVRAKKGQTAADRVQSLIKMKLFDRLSQQYPDFGSKIVSINGDIIEPDLGISASDRDKLMSEVSIVFHSAATVKFDEALRLSVQMNVAGTKMMFSLAKNMKKLEAFIHVSTAYANCDRARVTETVYPAPIHPSQLLAAVQWMDDDMLDALTPLLVRPRPNTYTFTKAVAECVVLEERGHVPTAIVRPSIVGAAWQEPCPGWVDNFNGPTGLLAAIGKGLLRIMKGNYHGTADIIPVDLATNLMISVAWSTAIDRPDNVLVYNCTTGQLNRLTWGNVERGSATYFTKNPVEDMFRPPNPRFTRSSIYHWFNIWMSQILPAHLIDFALQLAGKRPIMRTLNSRICKSCSTLDFFTSHQWIFDNDNVLALAGKLSEEDRREFNFDVKRINWNTYMENYCLGTKTYVLKEDLANLPRARTTLKRLQRLQTVLQLLVGALIWRFLWSRVPIARTLWFFLLSWAVRIFSRIPGFAKS